MQLELAFWCACSRELRRVLVGHRSSMMNPPRASAPHERRISPLRMLRPRTVAGARPGAGGGGLGNHSTPQGSISARHAARSGCSLNRNACSRGALALSRVRYYHVLSRRREITCSDFSTCSWSSHFGVRDSRIDACAKEHDGDRFGVYTRHMTQQWRHRVTYEAVCTTRCVTAVATACAWSDTASPPPSSRNSRALLRGSAFPPPWTNVWRASSC